MRKYTLNDEHQFRQHFGLELKDFWDLTGFDIIKFDDFMHPPDGVSLREHLATNYSEDAAKLVERLIHIW